MTLLSQIYTLQKVEGSTELIAVVNPVNAHLYFEKQSCMTLEKAFNSGMNLSQLDKENPRDLRNGITNLICMLNETTNVPTKVSNIQAMEITYYIIKNYSTLKFDELILILREGKTGKYGKNYQKIDIETINLWILAYLDNDDRCVMIEQIYEEEKGKLKRGELPVDDKYKDVPCDPMAIVNIIKAAEDRKKAKDLQHKATVKQEQFDGKMFRLKQSVKIVPDADLYKFIDDYNGVSEALLIINDEITFRKLRVLAKKIIDGSDRNFSAEEMELKINYAIPLEEIILQHKK